MNDYTLIIAVLLLACLALLIVLLIRQNSSLHQQEQSRLQQENSLLPQNRVHSLLLTLYGKPYISLCSSASDAGCGPDSAPQAVFNCIKKKYPRFCVIVSVNCC